MKKRTILWVVLAILLLIIVDQGAKMAVDLFYEEPEGIMQVSNTVHIHRIFNDEDALEAQARAEETNLSYGFWMTVHILGLVVIAVSMLGVFLFVNHFFFWDLDAYKYPKLMGAWFSLSASAMICHIIDEIFRGGCPDFICIARDYKEPVGDHFHDAILHHACDLKDIFLFIGTVLLIVRVIIWMISAAKNDKNITEKFKHPIRNLKAAFKKGGKTEETL